MKRHASLVLMIIAIAAAVMAWKRSGDVAALRKEYKELVRMRPASLPARAETNSIPAVHAMARNPALEKMVTALKEIAARPGDMQSSEKRHALIDWLGTATATLSNPQLIELAKFAHRLFPNAQDAEGVADTVLTVVFEHDPGTALDALLELHPGSTNLFMHWLAGWATGDPAAARAWRERASLRFKGSAEIEQAVSSAFGIADSHHPSVHIPQILSGEAAESDTGLRREMAKYLSSPERSRSLLEAIANCPDAKRHDHLLNELGKEAAQSMNPGTLREFCATAPLTDLDKLRLCTAAVTGSIDERTPERAAWMFSLCPDTAAKSAAAAALTAEWARKDFNTAGNWINSLTNKDDQPVRDAAAAKFAEVVTAIEPAAAAAWAHTISDATLREESLRSVLAAWSHKDRPAATAFAASNHLSEDLLPAE